MKRPAPDLYPQIQALIARLRAEGCAEAAQMLEARISGGATGTEILVGLSGGFTRLAFRQKGISWKLRKDMLVLSWRIDQAVRV